MAAETSAPAQGRDGLSATLKNSITIMAVVALASILILLFGDFHGKVPRIGSTFLVFAVFTVFTAFDAREDGPPHRNPIAQIGNVYMLGLNLVFTWGSLLVANFNDTWLIPKTLFLMLILKLGIFVVQRVADLTYAPQQPLAKWAQAAVIGLVSTSVLLTLPMGLDFWIRFADTYWRIVYAVLTGTGLSVAVTTLLFNVYRRQPGAVPNPFTGSRWTAKAPPAPYPSRPGPGQGPAHAPAFSAPAPKQPRFQAQRPSAFPPQGPTVPPQYLPPLQGSLPWPTFPDGRPLPMAPNGRPDWTALHHVAWINAEAERQWFPPGQGSPSRHLDGQETW